jgi:exopolyphosphatase/guanosine-5'-triphosphate,3'-diphosphate pyrophosphatase
MHRSHDKEPIPVSVLRVDGDQLNLRLSKRWLAEHPLTRADLDTETEYLRDIDYKLSVKTG